MDNEGDIFRRCERVGRLFTAIFLSSGWKPIVNIFGKKKVANYQACAMLSAALGSVNPIASLRQCWKILVKLSVILFIIIIYSASWTSFNKFLFGLNKTEWMKDLIEVSTVFSSKKTNWGHCLRIKIYQNYIKLKLQTLQFIMYRIDR